MPCLAVFFGIFRVCPHKFKQSDNGGESMRLLRLGNMGPSVQLLQLALNRAGFGPLEQDGVFGTATQNALARFQQALAAEEAAVAEMK